MAITKRVGKNGKTSYVVREYTGFTIDGKLDRVSITCRTLKEAQVEQAKLIAQRDAARNRSGKMLFARYVHDWFWPSKKGLAATTKDAYEREIRLRLIPTFGKLDIRDIDRIKIQKFINTQCKTEKGARKAVGVLKTILNEALTDGLIIRNPACSKFAWPDNPGKNRDNGLIVSTFEGMKPIFEAIDEYNDETIEKLAVTGLLAGLRPEERYGLDWKDFDLNERILYVRQAYTYASKRHGGTKEKVPKTKNAVRAVPLMKQAAERLQKLQKHDNIIKAGPFILNAHNERITPSSAQKKWRRFLVWCNKNDKTIVPVTLENMRHSFATSYLHAGGAIE